MPSNPATTSDALHAFEPLVRDYFTRAFGAPTDVQQRSWPVIAAGEHALITAPTGSGKTLTAFLWALNKFAAGTLVPGRTSVLYISPLKALNNDIQANLLGPLAALGTDPRYPSVRALTRSGDTTASDRQRMLRKPPEILITTPESLTLLLTTVRGRQALGHIDTVILDEVHSLVDNRRGVQLLTALERLCWMGLEPQRIALSATVTPLAAVAGYVAGYDRHGAPRPIRTIASTTAKAIDFRVNLPAGALGAADRGKQVWEPLADAFKQRLRGNDATLFFTNSRRLAEKITLKINAGESAPLAYAHHGSLAKDIRLAVEQRLKAGELRAIVATSSLEMGIDIGHLDEVVLIQSPPGVAATLQRIGRSGHRVGETSRGTLFPTHAHDFLEAAALATAVNLRDIEPLKLMRNPLDLLAQLVISCTASEDWDVDDLYHRLRCAAPYHDLPRAHFDSVVEMLAGRYAGLRLRDLAPRITFDRINGVIRATKGAVLAFYSSGGTIPDRGYYKLRHAGSGQIIGELDEEFVWEAVVGQTFNLGSGHWQIHRITHDDVLVNPAPTNVHAPPFWRSEDVNRDYHFSRHIGAFLDRAEAALRRHDAAGLHAELTSTNGFDAPAAEALIDYLTRQREHSGPLPGTQRILLERIHTGPGGYRSGGDEQQLVLHTFWGAQVNRPYALALGSAWRQRFGKAADIQADNDAVIIQLTEAIEPEELLRMVRASDLPTLLRAAVEDSNFFGARFRECAGRALLLTRKRFNQRLPLWLTRMQSKKLLAATRTLTDFPILLETWRTCLDDEFDLPALETLLHALHDGEIEWRYVTSGTPSPFAANLSWNQVSRFMYADDQPEGASGPSLLAADLLASTFAERPSVSAAVVAEFLAKRQRLHPNYLPTDAGDWHEWLKERVLLPAAEVADDMPRGAPLLRLTDGTRDWWCHLENAANLCSAFDLRSVDGDDLPAVVDAREPLSLLQEILSFYGPLTHAALADLLPRTALPLLDATDFLIEGKLLRGDPNPHLCDVENFEILLRFQRRAARPTVEPLAVTQWPGWLAHWHNCGAAETAQATTQLRGFAAPVSVWLHELLPPRLPPGTPVQAELQVTAAELDLGWVGTGVERIAIDYAEDLPRHTDGDAQASTAAAFTDPRARYPFTALLDTTSSASDAFNELLWLDIWAGTVTSDSLQTLQVAALAGYQLRGYSGSRRARRVSWPGAFSLIAPATAEIDALATLEAAKDSARTLLDRYGIVCRELANREGHPFKWRTLFSALRVMELAGEVVAGAFFEQFSGPQFATPAALRAFIEPRQPRNFLVNALDPISPSGLGLNWPDVELLHRRSGNHYVFVAGELTLLSANNGERLTFVCSADHAATRIAWELFGDLVGRRGRVQPQKINDLPARGSPYFDVLVSNPPSRFTLHSDHKGVYFEASRRE